ncbi:hypothetical protein NHQ30_003020 [Ciborinia camelliae]|nr:hypothetical protein NHQ30_003020 [Ciborinia camelliae]
MSYVVSVLIRISALEKVSTSGSIAAADLARACGVNMSLITRSMRVLVTNGIAEETERDTYMHNELSRQFAPALLGGFTSTSFDNIRAIGALPDYVKTHKSADSLGDATRSPFSFAMGHEGKTTSICRRHRRRHGSDLQVVIESLKPEGIPGIEAMSYNMLTPQPIKNAHVYFMRRVLHDFPDKIVVTMLKSTVLAMGPDSRLVVGDMLLPGQVTVGGPWAAYWIELALLIICGKVRSLREWKAIYEEVGLELVEVYKAGDGQTVTLETRLRRSS